jgi:general secretion pathway protein K
VNRDDNAIIFSTIFDAQGRFNLNNLGDSAAQVGFIRLMQSAVPRTSPETARDLAIAVAHWITPGALNNNLDDYYLKSDPPYRAPHRPMVSVSEFRLLKGVTPELFAALAPYITVLPEGTPVNINNAPAPVLMSLSPTLTLPAAATIVAQRSQAPFPNTQSFLQFDVVKNNPIPENQVTVLSNYFLVKTNVKVTQQEILLYTLLKRMGKNDQPFTTILWQSKGTL